MATTTKLGRTQRRFKLDDGHLCPDRRRGHYTEPVDGHYIVPANFIRARMVGVDLTAYRFFLVSDEPLKANRSEDVWELVRIENFGTMDSWRFEWQDTEKFSPLYLCRGAVEAEFGPECNRLFVKGYGKRS